MCGILAAFGTKDYQKAISQSKLLTHRGPDESDHVILDHLPCWWNFMSRTP